MPSRWPWLLPAISFMRPDGGNDSGGVAPGVNVSMYSINTSTGALTSTGTTSAGFSPVSFAIDPFGKFAYVANSASNNVSMYTTSLVFLGGCGGGSYQSINNQSLNPTPNDHHTLAQQCLDQGGAASRLRSMGQISSQLRESTSVGPLAAHHVRQRHADWSAAIPLTSDCLCRYRSSGCYLPRARRGHIECGGLHQGLTFNPVVPLSHALNPNCAPAGEQAIHFMSLLH